MMKKKWLIITLLIVVALIATFWYRSSSDVSDPITVKVTKGDLIEKVTAVGSIVPRLAISVKSPIAGTVATLYQDAGTLVEQGQNLIEIKPDPTPEQYARAKQQVAIDTAKETEAKADWDRFSFLVAKGALSKNDQNYSQVKARYEEAKLQRSLSEQQLALLEKGKAQIGGRQIANEIKSPISGYILKRNVNIGDPVVAQSSSQPGNVLFTIADMNDMVFKGQVSQIDAAKLKENMAAAIKIAALPKVIIDGVLDKLALQSVQQDNMQNGSSSQKSPFNVGFTVEIDKLQPPEGLQLRAGYSATAEIVIKKVAEALMVPERVLFFEDDKPYVWLKEQNGSAEKVPIEIGLSDGINIEVKKGLEEGQEILVSSPEQDELTALEPRKQRRVRIR